MEQQAYLPLRPVYRLARVVVLLLGVALICVAAPLPVSAATVYKSGTITVDETWTVGNV